MLSDITTIVYCQYLTTTPINVKYSSKHPTIMTETNFFTFYVILPYPIQSHKFRVKFVEIIYIIPLNRCIIAFKNTNRF